MKLEIISENRFWIAINKPAGLIVEKNPFESPNIEELVWDYISLSTKKPFLGIVHRLDRVTSGVLILAKKKLALKELNKQFSNRSVKKKYLAITEHIPKESKGTLEHWLEKDQKNKRAILHTEQHKNTKLAKLSYEVVEKNASQALVELSPETGRFHQIRVQLSSIGCPILGDEKYGATQDYAHRQIALHASQLTFQDPLTEEIFTLTAESPFKNLFE